jgi:hypothetical protein
MTSQLIESSVAANPITLSQAGSSGRRVEVFTGQR